MWLDLSPVKEPYKNRWEGQQKVDLMGLSVHHYKDLGFSMVW